MTNSLASLELKAPPVVLAATTGVFMWFAKLAAPAAAIPVPTNGAGFITLALIGGLVCLAGVVSFRRAKTTVNPMRPDSASALVVSGIYRYTRNPMYLGFLLILTGWALFLANLLTLLLIPAFLGYMNRFQISPEERVLLSLFPHDYVKYLGRARRWL